MARTAVTVEVLSRTGAATGAGTDADPTNDHVVDLGGYPPGLLLHPFGSPTCPMLKLANDSFGSVAVFYSRRPLASRSSNDDRPELRYRQSPE
jgi:hypothetical protein